MKISELKVLLELYPDDLQVITTGYDRDGNTLTLGVTDVESCGEYLELTLDATPKGRHSQH